MRDLPRAMRVTGARRDATTTRKKTPGRAIVAAPGQRRHKVGELLNVFEAGALELLAAEDKVRVALSWVTGGFRVDQIEYL